MRIDSKRWEDAQRFEFHEWQTVRNAEKMEWDEAFRKYEHYLADQSSKLALNVNSKILDVGCNVTCISRLLKLGRHFGVEPLADKLNIPERVKDVEIKQGMGENLPYSDSFFEICFCRNVIDHTQEPDKVITEMYRVLRPGGYMILASYVYNPFIWFVKTISEVLHLMHNVGHPYIYTMETLEQLASLGQRFQIIDKTIIYEGKDPNDFGKVEEIKGNLGIVQRFIMLLNDYIFMQKWFVREYCLVCKRNN